MLKNPVVILHYHLRPGGVTKVIESQVTALQQAGTDYLVLSGEAYSGAKGMKQKVLGNLAYLTEVEGSIEEHAQALWESCQEAVEERFGSQPVTWLVHNPSLGKNVLWPALTARLASSGAPIFFQCHDFAEDGRPSNYALTASAQTVYPVGPHIHYGFINARDLALLTKAGLPPENSHLIANEVSPPELPPVSSSVTAQKVVLYPVRGIRRKNVGEFLLWCLLAPDNTTFALTLAPKNPHWLPYYEVWEELSKELGLDLHLGCVDRVCAPGQPGAGFEDWLQAATHCFTSSIAEGFGLSFLEPIALKKPILGRDLADITCDFKEAGITFDALYQRLLIPVKHVDLSALFEELIAGLQLNYRAYGIALSKELVEEACKHFVIEGCLDFGNLPEHWQVQIIKKIAQGELTELYVQLGDGTLHHAQQWFQQALSAPPRAAQSTAQFSPASYQKTLLGILSQVENSAKGTEETHYLEKEKVLAAYLDPKRFHFLRT